MSGLLLLSLRSAQILLRSGAPLLLLPPAFWGLCLLLQGRMGFDGLLPLLLFGLWLPLPFFALILRRRLPFLGPGDPCLPWAFSLPVRAWAFRLFLLGGALAAALLLQFLVSVETSLGILSLRQGGGLGLAETLRPEPGNPPLLSPKHPIQRFACPRLRGEGQLSFQPRRFLLSGSEDWLSLSFVAKGKAPFLLGRFLVGPAPRRVQLPLDIPLGEGALAFQLEGTPHGPITLERAPVFWLQKNLGPWEAGLALLLCLLPWTWTLVCGSFFCASFLRRKSYALSVFFLALLPVLLPGFPGIKLAALQLGAIPKLSLGSSGLWFLPLILLALLSPSRRGARR